MVGVLIHALLWAAATAAALIVLLNLLTVLTGDAHPFIKAALPLPVFAGVLVFLLWRNRRVRSTGEVALWLEGLVPRLGYSLVTLAEGSSGAGLEETVARTSWTGPVRQVLIRRALGPGLLLAAALTLLLVMPSLVHGGGYSVPGRPPGMTGTLGSDPFGSLVVTVIPPAYSRLPRTRLERPEAITSLVGSAIQLDAGGWTAATVMPDTATPFWLEREGQRRLIVLLPQLDSAPSVQLLAPSRDSVLHGSGGSLALSSVTRDDFGLASTWFEYIVSSGEGENFTFRSGVVGRRTLDNAPRFQIQSRIILDSLKLSPGNVVHLRAVSQDGNTVTGPGIGYSETRTFRIPRPGEGDSVSVEQVARAEGDSSLLSQRLLVIMAEALERRRPRLRRDTFVLESRRIADEQATLRRRVADIIFLRLGAEGSMEEGDSTAEPLTPEALLEAAEQATVTSGAEAIDFAEDETPVVALNRPLLEAYNAMWAAGRELEIGEPRRALPHMREALEAIQRARQAERIYLRGRPATSVIDLAKVRLAGNLADAAPSATTEGIRDRRIREVLLGRFSRALELAPGPAVADSLQLLRIDALATEPRFAAALGDAVTALRAGHDATGELVRARRLLAGGGRSRAGLALWDFGP